MLTRNREGRKEAPDKTRPQTRLWSGWAHDLSGIGRHQKLLTLTIMTNPECAGKQSEGNGSEARPLIVFDELVVGGVEM